MRCGPCRLRVRGTCGIADLFESLDARDRMSRHLDECAACRRDLERARREGQEVLELLERLDHGRSFAGFRE
jgi:hypothetical protein